MATSRAFAYNTGATVSGTEQVGNLAVVVSSGVNYSNGLTWVNGPDEDLGYVVARSGVNRTIAGKGATVPVAFWRSATKTDAALLDLVNSTLGQTFATASDAKTWLNANGYWTNWASLGTSFVGNFVSGAAPTATVETAWNTFRASLTGTYTSFTVSSTNGSSVTVTHPTLVQTLAGALKNAINNTSVTINSVIWRVGTGCGTPKIGGVAVEFSNVASCSASSTVALRPMINNLNWGGIGTGSTVGQATQTITLTFS